MIQLLLTAKNVIFTMKLVSYWTKKSWQSWSHEETDCQNVRNCTRYFISDWKV
jgi:hypothetical protein